MHAGSLKERSLTAISTLFAEPVAWARFAKTTPKSEPQLRAIKGERWGIPTALPVTNLSPKPAKGTRSGGGHKSNLT